MSIAHSHDRVSQSMTQSQQYQTSMQDTSLQQTTNVYRYKDKEQIVTPKLEKTMSPETADMLNTGSRLQKPDSFIDKDMPFNMAMQG